MERIVCISCGVAVICKCEVVFPLAFAPRRCWFVECPDRERLANHGRPEESAATAANAFILRWRVCEYPDCLHRRAQTLPDHRRIWRIVHRFISLADE